MNEFHNHLVPAEERARIRKLESFDEYEGFHEKCSHYIILTASKGIAKYGFYTTSKISTFF